MIGNSNKSDVAISSIKISNINISSSNSSSSSSRRRHNTQQWLQLVALLCIMLLPTSSVAASLRDRVSSHGPMKEVWNDPCNPSRRSEKTSLTLSLESQQNRNTYLDEHILTMKESVHDLRVMLQELTPLLAKRFAGPVTVLEQYSISDMGISLLSEIQSDTEWLQKTKGLYNLIARSFIFVDQMIQDEFGEGNLSEPMTEIRAALRESCLCPMYVYARSAHSTDPVDEHLDSTLTQIHLSLESDSSNSDGAMPGVGRSGRDYMIVRDLDKILRRMHYDIYEV